MNRNQPITDLKGQAADDLDRLLTSFFKSEMPAAFPPAPFPAAERPLPASRLPGNEVPAPVLTGPRVSLAVSVALLLGGCWLLSGRTADVPVPPHIQQGIDNGSATSKNRSVPKLPASRGGEKAIKALR